MAIDGIWREFTDVDAAVDFVLGNCIVCRKKCQGVFCRSCYREAPAEQRRTLVEKYRGRILGVEEDFS